MSELARKLIAENVAKRERGEDASFLDLGNCGLTELPEELGQCTWLEVLVLSNTWIERKAETEIWEHQESQNQGEANRLHYLNGVEGLKRLSKLVVGGYRVRWPLQDLSPLSGLQNLQSLDCGGTQVQDLSPLSGLQNLQSLRCSSTQVQDLSPLSGLQNLQSLYCGSTQVQDLSPLSGLQNLQSLYCGSTQVQDLRPLADLESLQTLGCGGTQVQDLRPLSGLQNLQSLNCAGTHIEDLSPLAKLQNLQSLDCRLTEVKYLSPLAALQKLQFLNCNHTKVQDLSPLSGLRNLQVVECRNKQVQDLSPLSNLVNLRSLNCSDTQIKDLSLVSNMKKLQSLSFWNTLVQDLSPLSSLQNLQSLYCHMTRVVDLSPLSGLQSLHSLNCSTNKVQDLSPLAKLQNLEWLICSNTQIQDLSPLSTLQNLQLLNCSHTQIQDLSPLSSLHNLQKLSCDKTPVQDLSPLVGLQNLQELYCGSTQVQDLSPLSNLNHLTTLNLSGNQISDLTLLLPLIKKGVPVTLEDPNAMFIEKRRFGINLHDNPLTNPPSEIAVQGNEAILSYFTSLQGSKKQEKTPINEIKILLVGEGMAGKTSLLKQIKGLDFQEKESQTHGVIIEKLPFDTLPLFKQYDHLAGVTGRFWDFGGQEIMHASHQFFLSRRSVYVLVLDSRTDAKKEEWLKHIEKFGGNSPTIVAINKIDENRNYDVERRTLNEKFPFIGNRFHKISCAQKEGLDGLAKELADLIPETEIFKTEFASAWVAIKEQLEEETAACNYIDQQRFEAICAENQVHDKAQQKTLLNYLDNLGIALHFENLGLKNFYVLDPHWVTIGVYKIINSPSIEGGIFEESMLEHILNVEQVKKTEYDPAKDKIVVYTDAEQQYLVKIMQQFKLLFEYANGKYLIPDLLPKEPTVDYAFDESGTEHIRFVLKYDFFPPTLMPQFIIRMKDDVQEVGRLWRYGVELNPENMGAQAIVKADKSEKRIDICVCGSTMAKREYFAYILKALKDIHRTYQKLDVKEFMPIPEYPDELVEYEELLGLENMGDDELKIGKLGEKFSVSNDFLDKISTKQQRMEEQDRQGDIYNINVHGGNIGNLGGKQGDVKQEVNQDATLSSNPKVPPQNELKMNKFYPFALICFLLIGAYGIYKVLNSPDGGKASITTDGVTVEKLPRNTDTSIDVPPANVYTIQVPIKINGEIPRPDQIGYMRATHMPAMTAELTSGGLFTFRELEIPKDKLLIFELFSKDGSSAGLAQTPFVAANSDGLSVLNTVQFTGTLDKKRNQYVNITVAPQFKVQTNTTVGDGNTTIQEQ